ncbi:hypothetical protein KPH14_010141 [Odynerus spinipes]|uniref:Uncharacterized protein n=1 Tax=Odynerus spinipes TaxID=1348599 RepID=A0AAD9RT66_9HYME|nr:hypothetical protein KPH14_010141 [Odynerus spinipes]
MNRYSELKWTGVEPGEEVVISGIAGRFPESDNVDILKENIMNSKDLITSDDRRWKLDHPEIPQRTGKVNNIEKFDALFFGVHFKQAHMMDPMCRTLLEHTYEAIVDAGVNPRQLRGTKTGVFIGACFSESEKTWFYEKVQVNGFGIVGCSRAMLANRISYWLGVTGPSYNIDSACSSSLFALEHGYKAIRSGQCDAAIVGGSNLCLHPYVSLQFSRLGVLCPDGRCKCFDEDANGYTRSETIAVVFLQKAKNAKRIYATVVHGKINCDGYKEQGITYPSSKMQRTLYEEFYEECGIPKTCLAYMEAHGTGTKVGDPEEVLAIDQAFSPGRTTPLKIGSVKSNLGHSEPASGLCSIAKAIITLETGIIPPTINFKRPRDNLHAILEGRIKVVSEPTPLDGEYVGVNSFGFGGGNAHILLKAYSKTKINKGMPKDDLPRLVAVSGRTEEAVEVLLNNIDNQPIDVEYIRLLQDLHIEEIPGHLYRGYTIAGLTTPEERIREIEYYSGAKRPIWFVFSGMGSQWPGMGQSLMRFPVFAKAIEKCNAVLKPHNINIYEILTKRDKDTFDNILYSFLGIAAVQIGLVDLLNSAGIVPDHIIGHSVGELGCAYADGCFTAEQMILAAYSRGIASTEVKIIRGSMAAVGLGYENLKDLCPPDIEIACHNGPNSSTISGPADSMKAFVEKLQANNIFAKEVPCSNIPYHSRYIAAAGPRLLTYLKKVIPEPKPRSQKWLSTSVPRKEWSSNAARFSSAEYHTNNLLKPVLFAETATLIPDNAVTIEIAPHGLLQAILKRSLPSTVTNIALTRRNHKDNVEVFLQALGKLYNIGFQPDIAKLYPPVEFPVSRGTPMISPHIRWDHTDDWFVASYKRQHKIVSGERTIKIFLDDEIFEYIDGHVIDGRNLFPATGYLSLVWETLGMMLGQLFTEVSVVMEDIKFNRATTIPKEGQVEMTIMIQKGSGRFEVSERGASIVTGMIRAESNISKERIPSDILQKEIDNEEEVMSKKDIYKEFKLRGYQYSGLFQSLRSATVTGGKGHIEWTHNWVTFMDNMLQLQILNLDTRGLFVPTGIKKLVIDASTHQCYLRSLPDEQKYVPVRYYKNYKVIVSGGVEIHGLKASAIARKKLMSEPVLEEYKFIAHRDKKEIPLREILTLSTHIALENQKIIKVKTVEFIDDSENISVEKLVSPLLSEILGDLPLIQANVNLFTPQQNFEEDQLPQNIVVSEPKKLHTDGTALIAIGSELLTKEKRKNLEQLLLCLREGAFLLSREKLNETPDFSILKELELDIILEKRTSEESWILLKKKTNIPKTTVFICVNNNEFSWVNKVKDALERNETETLNHIRVILVGEESFESGLLGFVNCLRQEPGGEIFRAVLIQDPKAPKFSLEHPLYSEQLKIDLAMNVLRPGNVWGSYRHLLLPPIESKPVYHAFVNQIVRGDVNTLSWLGGSIPETFQSDDLIRIYYASLNFKDVLIATGKLAAEIVIPNRKNMDSTVGFEYSGITSTGRRIMGIFERSLSNLQIDNHILSWTIPDHWSLEDAATIPCVYCTCIYAFYIKGNMKKGHKVLIHAGSGGIGQAAINLALAEGCEVFTTVGTYEKRQFIKQHFPSIDDDHIGNSRDTSFEQLILRQTNGKGVDIILNSLAEDKLQASIRCLAQGGQFLEIGKVDLVADNSLGMGIFLEDISYHAVMLDKLMVSGGELISVVKRKFQEYLENGSIKPLSRKVFNQNQIVEAFRYMAAGKHMGKVMIQIRKENEPLNQPIMAQPRYFCSPNKSYVILGGLGGFGMELVDWMIMRNAQNIVLTSRNGVKNGYQRMRIKLWESYGVNIVVLTGLDASKRKDCELILQKARDLGPIDGIYNLAVSLKDGICKNQTIENFEESFRAKAWATACLDEVSRELCPELRHFVAFSSVSCGRGNAGQTNYGMANSVMERICERRVEEGLPGLCIQWGAIGEVGLVADMQENHKELIIGGTLQQKISSCLHELDRFLVQNKPIVASMVVAEKRAGRSGTSDIVDTVLNIMSIKDLKTVGQQTPLAELGMDSMMAVEIKQTLEREFDVYLTAQDIRSMNFAKLIELNNARTGKNTSNQKLKETLDGMKLLMQLFGEKHCSDVTIPLKTKPRIGESEIFFLPGIEGYSGVFQTLAPKIASPATCLQLASNHDYKTVEDMANGLLPHLLVKLKGRTDFTLVGYSFGSLVAIELVQRLESEGFNGHLFLIDGSPEYMKALIKQHVYLSVDEEIESSILLGIMDTFIPTNSAQLAIDLSKCNTWDERLNAFLAMISTEQKKQIPEEIYRDGTIAFYTRIQASIAYAPEPLPYIRTPITLIKPTIAPIQDISEDYGLQKITQGKVEIHVVEGNHVTILENAKVAMAINREQLDDAEAFKESIMTTTNSFLDDITSNTEHKRS